MLIKRSTDKSIGEVAEVMEAAVTDNHFGLMQVHNLKQTMMKKGVEFENECMIFEVCQPNQAKKVLEENMGISTALPCRISVYRENGKTTLATIKPSVLLGMFDSPQLKGVAEEVEKTLTKIMEDVVSK